MRRWVLRALAGAGLSTVFAGALLGGVILHANLPGFRRAATSIANDSLEPLFEGKVVVGAIDRLELGSKSRVVVHSAELLDPEGHRVARADTLDATIDLRSLLRSIAGGKGPAVELENVRLESADLVLDRAPDGQPLIAKAFHPRARAKKTSSTTKPTEPATPTEPYLDIASARIAHAKVRGNLVPPSLDGETEGLLVRVHLEHEVVRVDLDEGKATLRAPQVPNQKEPITGSVKGALSMDLAKPRLSGRAELLGGIGAVPVVARATMDGDVVDATVDVARVDAAPLGQAFRDLPFGRPVEAHAHAHGTLPVLAIDLRGRVGESDITGSGSIDLREGHAFSLDADAQHVDASAYGAPFATDVTTKVKVTGKVADKARLGVTGTYTVETQAGTVADQRIPSVTIEGELQERGITARLETKDEPGVELGGTASLDLDRMVADFDLAASSRNLRSAARVPAKIDGAANASAHGTVDLRAQTIDARTAVRGDALAFDAFAAAHLDASGRLHGPLQAPLLDLDFTGKELQVKTKEKAPLLYPAASGRARVTFVPTISIAIASLDVGEKGSPNAIGASAANVTIAHGTVEARGVQLTGLGEPLELDASFGPGNFHVRAKSAGVDLRRVATATGLKELRVVPAGTRAVLDVDLRDDVGGATGHADVVVTSEKGALLAGGVKLETHAKLDRGHLVGMAKVSSEGLGEVEITSADVNLPGRLDGRALERATGLVELRGSVDLAQGGALLGGEKIEQMSGLARFEGRIERGDPAALPAVRATVKTEGLDVTYSEDPAKPSIHVTGIDIATHVDWDGRTDDTEVAFFSWDHKGVLGNGTAKAKVPLVAWVTGARRISRRSVADIDVNATVDVPLREVADLPAFLDLPALRGMVGAHVALTGEVAHPSLTVSAKAEGLGTAPRPRGAGAAPTGAVAFEPFDGLLEARWNGQTGVVTFALDEREAATTGGRGGGDRRTSARVDPTFPGATAPRRTKRGAGHVHGLVTVNDAKMSDLLRGRSPLEMPWTAATEIDIQDLSLGGLPIPATTTTRQITGSLTGRIKLRDVNRAASFEANGTVTDFGVGGATVKTLTVTAGGRDASLFVNATAKDEGSQATLQLASQSLRVNGLDVDWDESKPSRLDYAVQNARLGLLLPLVRRSISELDGRVNGVGSITVEGPSQVFEGGLALTQTSVYVNAVGEEVTGLNAIARFERSGAFSIEDASGKLGAGEFHATARGRMKGFSFSTLDGTVTATKEGIPISSDGANFASAVGQVDVEAAMSADRSKLEVKLMVPNANIVLPDRSTQQLQTIDPDKTIDIGVRRKDGSLDTSVVRRGRGGTGRQPVSTASFATKLDATLGDHVRLEGRGLNILLGGKTYVQVGAELAVTGQIDLRGGTIEVHGRRFAVDRGIVTFPEGGDPTNPSVVAAAYWDAPDRSRVWVEFAGPLKSGRLTLRSEPSYSKNEILSILLFGQPDPNLAAPGADAGTTTGGEANGATAIGSGFVAADVNRMLSELDENLSYETDTLSGNRTRHKAGRSFFDQRLKVQVGYAPGQTTYREPDTAFLLLNWQFVPKWSLLGTRGDRGTSIIDVLWQHRY